MSAWLGPIAVLAAQAPAPCVAILCQAEVLAPLLAALESRRPVHLLLLGDSHMAGDMISQAWRRRLQRRYGDGGRGVLAAGRPYPGYLTWNVTAGQSDGWRVNAAFGRAYAPGGPPLGLSGFTQTAQARGESLSLRADPGAEGFDRVIICAVARPGGGSIILSLGGVEERFSLVAPAVTPVCHTIDSDEEVASTTLFTEDAGIVSITSFSVFRRNEGVVLSNLGVSGAQLSHFGRTDDGVVAGELAAYRPDLIVLAFGTNEGFSPLLTPDTYEAGLREQVSRIRRLTGRDVPILLLGAPDAATRAEGLSGADCGDGWHVPQLLSEVREQQRQVARELDLAFWDWSAAMGGRCSTLAWRRDGMMRGDHVHFTRTGGDRIGAMIDADFARAVEEVR